MAKAAAGLPVLRALIRFLLAVALALTASAANAHKASDAYLTLDVKGRVVTGQWDIALRDLDFVLLLDADGDGAIRWGEVERRRGAILSYAVSHLMLDADGRACTLVVRDLLIDRHSDGAYAVLLLSGRCPSVPRRIGVEYRLFADVDPAHRGLTHLRAGTTDATLILGGDRPQQTVMLNAWGRLAEIGNFVRTGVWHIWTGYDHLLFLLSLLLPAVLCRVDGHWVARPSFRKAALEVLKVVTAFTLAHSLTLSFAVTTVVTIPSRVTESLIAASVVLAALNNLRPVVTRKVWAVAFGFGLIHGFGFATVLHDLALPKASLLLALFAFNVGVEFGQLAVVVAVMPIVWLSRGQRFYTRGVMHGGSIMITLLALMWFAERALDMTVLASPVLRAALVYRAISRHL